MRHVMARKKPKQNRLARYLRKHELSQQEFADRVSLIRGWVVYQSAVNRWARGRIVPNREMRDYIARATEGQVPADCW